MTRTSWFPFVLLDDYDESHVDELGLKSLSNGKLVEYARENFDLLLTLDRGILHQHNHSGQLLRILVVRTPDSTIDSLEGRVADVLSWIAASNPGQTAEI